MVPAAFPKRTAFSLTSADRARLENIAPIFGICFQQTDERTYSLRTLDEAGHFEISLSAEMAHIRLLNEIGSRAAKWVYFRIGVSCRDTLLGLSDSRLQRVAELYCLDRQLLKPTDI